jgi:hypothetical protein
MTEPTLGHNNPPEPTPFEASRDAIAGIMIEARGWFDGEPVTTKAQADEIAKLLDMARKARKAADDARKAENEPFDTGKAEVQARYNPLLKNADLIADIAKKCLAPYLEKLDAEKRVIAAKARAEADAKQVAAQEALRASQATDIAARAEAEAMIAEAVRADALARKAETDKAGAKGGARAVTLRSTYVATIVDPVAAARHMWATRKDMMLAYITELAQQQVNAGLRDIPGVEIVEKKGAV